MQVNILSAELLHETASQPLSTFPSTEISRWELPLSSPLRVA